MPLYAGTTLRVKSTATDFDGAALTPLNVRTVDITIYDPLGVISIDAAAMVWDTVHLYWYYDWQTVPAGTYRARCRYQGVNYVAWDYVRIVTKADIEPPP